MKLQIAVFKWQTQQRESALKLSVGVCHNRFIVDSQDALGETSLPVLGQSF